MEEKLIEAKEMAGKYMEIHLKIKELEEEKKKYSEFFKEFLEDNGMKSFTCEEFQGQKMQILEKKEYAFGPEIVRMEIALKDMKRKFKTSHNHIKLTKTARLYKA